MGSASQDLSRGRLVVQSLAVILSILVAFALDAWWESAHEAGEEREILRQLDVEVTATIAEIQDLQGSLEGWEELQAKLSGWGDMLQDIKASEAAANDFVWEHVYPYLETRVRALDHLEGLSALLHAEIGEAD